MPRKARARANGPYRHGNQWRVALSPPPLDGSSRYRYYSTEREAKEYADEFNLGAAIGTLGETVDMYLEHLKQYGGGRGPVKTESAQTTGYQLRGLLALGCKVGDFYEHDRPLNRLTEYQAHRLYGERIDKVSAATHHQELVKAGAMFDWVVENGWMDANPFAKVQPRGRAKVGKEQLRINEERDFIKVALAENTLAGVAVVAVTILGLRASELLGRVGRDVDDGGRVLWIPDSKTPSGRRTLVVPDVYGLRAKLQELADRSGADGKLFGQMVRWTLRDHVHRFCELAGVPEVTTHALRGGTATRIVEQGGSIESAARYIGHANTAVTRRHYLAPGVEQSARAASKAAILEPDPEDSDPKPTNSESEEPNIADLIELS